MSKLLGYALCAASDFLEAQSIIGNTRAIRDSTNDNNHAIDVENL
jgi:hypothetical protein